MSSPHRPAFIEIERQFHTLCSSARPLAVDGYEIDPAMPDRAIPLDELRTVLLSRQVGNDVKNAAWSLLVQLSRKDPERWIIGCVGMMLPGLRRIVRSLSIDYIGDIQDLESEVLLGFLETLQAVDPHSRAIAPLLWWSAKRRGLAARTAEFRARAYGLPEGDAFSPGRVVPAPGHPDLVLVQAVDRGVLSSEDAELVGTTRLSSEPLDDVASRMGLTYAACRKRRSREPYRVRWRP